MTGGRPLRFLALMLCLWVGARGFAIYRDGVIGQAVSRIAPVARAVASFVATPAAAAPAPRWDVASAPVRVSILGRPDHRFERVAAGVASVLPSAGAGTPPAPLAQTRIVAPLPPQPVLGPALRPSPIARGPSRLTGSAWMIARGGMTSSVTGSQLGGSQAGARLTYALGTRRRVALAARVSAPLAGVGREAAFGIDWQPTRAPVHILVERRIAIDGGRGGTMVGVIGGFGPQPVAPGVTLEGYGQAGIIARDGGEAFADGALRAAHPLARLGGLRLDIGAGAWGGAQRGASRLDVGPSLGIVVPVGRRRLRLTADWRERIAGNARPGSGPALSLGTDF